MASKVFTFVLALAVACVWAAGANAQQRHHIMGSMGFQIGDGLPIPITGNPPVGAVKATSRAGVTQTSGPDPKAMAVPQSIFHVDRNFGVNIGVFNNNSKVFQVRTALIIDFPNAPANFSAGGRTGASVVTFCPGQTVTSSGNPGCTSPVVGQAVGTNGLMRYTKTTNQFGGPARAKVGGPATVGLVAAAGGSPSPVPCDYTVEACQVIFNLASPAPTGAQGAAFGLTASAPGIVPTNGVFQVKVDGNGVITSITPTGLGAPGVDNGAVSWGGPWTTGMLSITVNVTAMGATEFFTLTGSDNRVDGVGRLSLVSGAVSSRNASLGNANRGWLNIRTAAVTPSISTWGLGALALILAGVAARKIRGSAV